MALLCYRELEIVVQCCASICALECSATCGHISDWSDPEVIGAKRDWWQFFVIQINCKKILSQLF